MGNIEFDGAESSGDPASGPSFTQRVVAILKAIPEGSVVSYGQVAAMAGNPRGARQVVRVLNSKSRSEDLPWHRVINREGRISLPRGGGFEIQRGLLENEGVEVSEEGIIDLDVYGI